MRNAKIVCTLGPASSERDVIADLAKVGMSVARLNASHGTIEERAAIIDRVRAIERETKHSVATMLDLRGPEIRTAEVDDPITLDLGDEVRFTEAEFVDPPVIGLTLDITGVEPGTSILLDDGQIKTVVAAVEGDEVIATVKTGGTLTSRTGVNIPGVNLDVDIVTAADEAELDLAVEKEVDFIAASFVADAADVLAVSEALEQRGGSIPIIAKIERDAARRNADEIIDAAYGVMVARGDLGVECPLEEVPVIQKQLIRACQRAGVPVITATEMLDSMMHARRPTRAEASDVANAVLDGADAVMLSGETAIGDHPVAVVETMDRLIRTIEASEDYSDLREQRVPPAAGSNTGALAKSARYLARDLRAKAIVVASESGYTARKVTKFRPGVPTIAVTPSTRVKRQLALSWGVHPVVSQLGEGDVTNVIQRAADAAFTSALIEGGDTLVVLSGHMTDVDRETANTLQVHIAAERIGVGTGVVAGEASGPMVSSADGIIGDIPTGSILYLSERFDDELVGNLSRLGGIIHERPGMTGYPALIARELGIPMASGVSLSSDLDVGEEITLDGDRGVVYRGDVTV